MLLLSMNKHNFIIKIRILYGIWSVVRCCVFTLFTAWNEKRNEFFYIQYIARSLTSLFCFFLFYRVALLYLDAIKSCLNKWQKGFGWDETKSTRSDSVLHMCIAKRHIVWAKIILKSFAFECFELRNLSRQRRYDRYNNSTCKMFSECEKKMKEATKCIKMCIAISLSCQKQLIPFGWTAFAFNEIECLMIWQRVCGNFSTTRSLQYQA